MNTYDWYSQLIKPFWAPPAWLFGPVWTVLYILIAISFGVVFYKAFAGKLPWLVALPFALNLVFNLAFTSIQFPSAGSGQAVSDIRMLLAAVDILLVLGTLVWALFAIYTFGLKLHIETGAPTLAWIIYLNAPYLLWVTFATVLQLTITYLNR